MYALNTDWRRRNNDFAYHSIIHRASTTGCSKKWHKVYGTISLLPYITESLVFSRMFRKKFFTWLEGPWSPKLTYTIYLFSWKCRILW